MVEIRPPGTIWDARRKPAMQLVYNSDNFVVVAFEPPAVEGRQVLGRGGFEVVDKFTRKEIYLEGAVAETFQQGVQALVEQGPDAERIDEFIGGFTVLAQQPVVMH
jgi:hypothetical protein